MKTVRLLVVLSLLLLPATAMGGNSPRDYIPLPPGTLFFATYYNHNWGGDYYRKGKYITGSTDYYSNIGMERIVYFTQLGPFTIDPQVIIPFGQVAVNDKHSSGFGDPILAATIWFVNNQESKFIIGYTPFLFVPIGAYDRSHGGVNLGSNRWSTKQELCIAKGFGDRVWWEFTGNVSFFGDNPDAYDGTPHSTTSSMRPVFGFESHLSVDIIKSKMFISADYYYAYGGETCLHGVWQKDWADTHTLGVTVAYMLASNMQLMADFKSDVSVYNGIRNNQIGTRVAFWF